MTNMPKLTVDTFMAALTVATLATACSKAAPSSTSATPEPAASIAPAATAPAPAPSGGGSSDSDKAAEPTAAVGAIDAGIEKKKAASPAARAKPTANAGCGAGACSDDMKK